MFIFSASFVREVTLRRNFDIPAYLQATIANADTSFVCQNARKVQENFYILHSINNNHVQIKEISKPTYFTSIFYFHKTQRDVIVMDWIVEADIVLISTNRLRASGTSSSINRVRYGEFYASQLGLYPENSYNLGKIYAVFEALERLVNDRCY